ncbi:MAG: endonuclease III [Treponema sp.]|jgi:endonuclease-3|nr:endonuclease III [Treponema sp.]
MDWELICAELELWMNSLDQKPSVTVVAEQTKHEPWAVLLSTVLSLRTRDAVTLVASHRLLAAAPIPAALLAMEEEQIASLIYPVGFYHTKAKSLKRIAEILIETYGGQVPSTMEELLALPGVGRKTANLVLIEAFDKDGICVDTHVHRICNRAGWVATKSPDQTETVLRAVLPLRYWKRINSFLVLYGQQICRPGKPRCSVCVIKAFCTSYQKP